MKAWMRNVQCAFGASVVLGSGTLFLGCSGSYTTRVQISPFGVYIEATYTPLDSSSHYDLDGLRSVTFGPDGDNYRFYPSKGWVYDTASGRLVQLDDASWHQLLKLYGFREAPEILQPDVLVHEEVQREWFGIFSPDVNSGVGLFDERVQIELNVNGDMPIPEIDERRWPSLKKNLFVFPDGIEGSPDPMRLELEGDSCDVFGYMAILGTKDVFASVDGNDWSAVFNDEQWVDVFINDTLFTSVPLH